MQIMRKNPPYHNPDLVYVAPPPVLHGGTDVQQAGKWRKDAQGASIVSGAADN